VLEPIRASRALDSRRIRRLYRRSPGLRQPPGASVPEPLQHENRLRGNVDERPRNRRDDHQGRADAGLYRERQAGEASPARARQTLHELLQHHVAPGAADYLRKSPELRGRAGEYFAAAPRTLVQVLGRPEAARIERDAWSGKIP